MYINFIDVYLSSVINRIFQWYLALQYDSVFDFECEENENSSVSQQTYNRLPKMQNYHRKTLAMWGFYVVLKNINIAVIDEEETFAHFSKSQLSDKFLISKLMLIYCRNACQN